jgi:hypothetical protein
MMYWKILLIKLPDYVTLSTSTYVNIAQEPCMWLGAIMKCFGDS